MPNSRPAALVSLVVAVGLASCTAVLGDFDVAPSGATDASTDTSAEVGGGLDATGDGAPQDVTQSEEGVDSGPPPCGAPNVSCCPRNVCNGGAQCNGTICVCPQNRVACGNACVDVENDTHNCGRCNHDCLGGTCSTHTCSAYSVTQSQGGIQNIFAAGGRLYWTRAVSGASSTPGGFYSSKYDGSDLVTIFDAAMTAGVSNGCYGAATAVGKGYFSCTNGAQYDIRVCTLPCAAGSSTVLKGGLASAREIAADPATANVFYTVPTPYNQPPNGSVFDVAGNRIGAANQAAPGNIVVANGSIYWVNAGTYSADQPQRNGGVKRVSLAAPTVESVVVTAGNYYIDLNALAVDAHNVYYTTSTGQAAVIVASITATAAGPAVFTSAGGYSVASDDTNVFFDDFAGGAVKYCSRAGGCGAAPTLLSPSEKEVVTMTVDADSVIWGVYSGAIRRIAKP